MSLAVVTVLVILLLIVLFKKNRSLRARAMYLVINLNTAYMFVRGFSHFSLFVTLLYLCDIVQFPHLTLELALTTGFLFVWFPLTSLTNIAVMSLDQMHATIRPYTALRHRLIKKSTIEVLREEVELSNTRTAYVMHIPNTLSLTSARNNRKQKFQ